MLEEEKMFHVGFSSFHMHVYIVSNKISVLIRKILYFINLIGRQYKNEQRTHVLPEVKLELSQFFFCSCNLFLYNESITLECVIKLSKYSAKKKFISQELSVRLVSFRIHNRFT